MKTEAQKEYMRGWREKNREKVALYSLQYSRLHPVSKEKKSEYQSRYYQKHKDTVAAYHRRRYLLKKAEINKRNAQWWKDHPDKRREKDRRRAKKPHRLASRKAYRERNLEKVRAARRKWQRENKEHRQQYLERYYQLKKDAIKQRVRQYYRNNRDKYFASSIRRKALQLQASGNLKALRYFVKQTLKKEFSVCYYCQHTIHKSEVHFDHMIPLSKGGQHCVENICVSCSTCNLKKHARSISDWKRIGQQLLAI